MRSLFFLAVLLGVFLSLAAVYSFWVAFGTMHLAGLLIFTVMGFTLRPDH